MPPRSVQKARDFKQRLTTPEHRSARCAKLWSEATLQPSWDATLVCGDGVSLGCHQSVLAAASGFLRDLLAGVSARNGDGSLRLGDSVTFLLPDVNSDAVVKCLSLLYDGVAGVSLEDKVATVGMKTIWKSLLQVDLVRLNDKTAIEAKLMKCPITRNFTSYKKETERYCDDEKLLQDNMEVAESEENVTVDEKSFRNPYFSDLKAEKVYMDEEQTPSKRPRKSSPSPLRKTTKTTATSKSSEQVREDDADTFRTPSPPVSNKKRKMSVEEELEQALRDIQTANKSDEDKLKQAKKERGYSEDDMKNILRNPSMKKPETSSQSSKYQVDSTPLFAVEVCHVCVICDGKTPDGKIDKDASNLSFSDLKKLKEHYCRHFYAEGKLFELIPLEERNKNEDGSIKDEFGRIYKYKCDKKSSTKPSEPCWKSKKRACGYKELALHNAAEHGVFERVLEIDTRPKVNQLAQQIREACEQ